MSIGDEPFEQFDRVGEPVLFFRRRRACGARVSQS